MSFLKLVDSGGWLHTVVRHDDDCSREWTPGVPVPDPGGDVYIDRDEEFGDMAFNIIKCNCVKSGAIRFPTIR